MPRSLLKILGVSFGLAVTVGNTIGAGILRTPGDVAAALPTPWLFLGVWLVGAAYALLGVNAIAELGTMLPRSGAQYVYARHTFGDYVGFLVGWNDWISTCASTAAISIVLGEALGALASDAGVGAFAHRDVGIGIAVVTVFTLLLWRGTKLGERSQELTSLFKALALIAFVIACLLFSGRGAASDIATASRPATTTMPLFLAFVLAAQGVIYTYDGWTGPLYFAEELRDPARQIPRSMYGGLLTIAAIYILINVAFMLAVPLQAMAGSNLAAATVATALFGARGAQVVRVVVALALPSAVIACLLMASRVLYGVSRDGLGPAVATRVNAGGTPTVSLLLSGLVSVLFIATGTFQSVIAVAAFFFVANYATSFLAVFVLRRREPLAPRPYRARGHPWTTGLVLAGSIAFLLGAVAQDTLNSLYALAIVVVSWPMFALVTRS
jgi:basic amino acid/polyamine antiporter, APA family